MKRRKSKYIPRSRRKVGAPVRQGQQRIAGERSEPEETVELAPADMSLEELSLELNDAQLAFCEYYVATRDVAKSYGMAYPKAKPESARVSGHRLMRNEYITEYIKRLIQEYGPKIRLSLDEIVAEVERIAMDEDITNAQKLKALKMLGQSQGEFEDRSRLEVTKSEFVIDVVDE